MAEATGELRQRRPSGNQEAEAPETPVEAEEVVVTPTLAVAKDVQEKRRVNALLAVAESKSPPWLAEKLKKFRPAVEAILKFLGKVAPVVVRGGTKAYAIYTILPHDVILMLYGACLCFFGGYFAASVAAIEAFRLTGGDTMIACIRDLIDEWNSLKHANDKDDVEDEDKDGKADVDQISESQLAVRKTLLALRTLNPDRVTQAIGGLTMGCMGILSTLKVKFAKVAALGVSIGNMMRKPAAKILVPAAAFLLGKDSPYLRWVDPVINYLCKSVAVSIAWFIQQIISTVQSALNGGLIFARAGMRFAAKKGLIKNIDPDETYLDEVVGWSLAAVGIIFQIGSGLRLPFPLNVFLLPLEIIEWALRYAITWA